MNIAYVASLPENIGGGATKVAFDLAREMSKIHQVVVIYPSEDGNEKISIENGLKKYGVKSVSQGELYTPVMSIKTISSLGKFLEEFDPDIVHSHAPFLLEQIMQNWCIDNNKPFFYTTHFMPTQIHTWFDLETLKQLGPKLLDNRIIKNFIRSFYNKSSAVIALNRESFEDLSKLGYDGKSFIIRNGMNLEHFNNLPLRSIKEKEIKMIYVGSISQRKNQDYLIKVMEYLPSSYKLILIGNIQDPSYLERLNAHIKDKNLQNIEVMGRIDFNNLPEIYKECHFFLSASKSEVQSLAVIEALVAGKPVICLENQTTREVINQSNGIALPQKSEPEEFANKILDIINSDESKYTEMACNARESVKNFDYSYVVKTTTDAYRSVLGVDREKSGKVSRKLLLAGIVVGTVGAYGAFKAIKRVSRGEDKK